MKGMFSEIQTWLGPFKKGEACRSAHFDRGDLFGSLKNISERSRNPGLSNTEGSRCGNSGAPTKARARRNQGLQPEPLLFPERTGVRLLSGEADAIKRRNGAWRHTRLIHAQQQKQRRRPQQAWSAWQRKAWGMEKGVAMVVVLRRFSSQERYLSNVALIFKFTNGGVKGFDEKDSIKKKCLPRRTPPRYRDARSARR